MRENRYLSGKGLHTYLSGRGLNRYLSDKALNTYLSGKGLPVSQSEVARVLSRLIDTQYRLSIWRQNIILPWSCIYLVYSYALSKSEKENS